MIAPIHVALIEDDPGIRETLAEWIDLAPHLRCVGAFRTAEEALAAIPPLRVDVALVDIHLPKIDGIECVRQLKARVPTLHALIITVFEDAEKIFAALQAGASGYLLKRTLASELLGAISDVHSGGAPMSQQIARKVVSFFHRKGSSALEVAALTKREREILALLAQGRMYKEIAELGGIALNTVRVHVHSIYEKLHVQSRTEAVNKYYGR